MKNSLLVLFLFTRIVVFSQTDEVFELLIQGSTDLEAIQQAIDNDADINAVSMQSYNWYTGMSPAHMAAAFSNLEVLKLLEKNGADIFSASEYMLPDAIEVALPACKPFHIAVYHFSKEKSPAFLDYLIAKGADVNEIGNGQDTPLMLAISNKENDIAVIKYLLSKGAKLDISEYFNDGLLALCVNSRHDRSDIARYLLELGAPMNIYQGLGEWDLLCNAIYFGKNKIAEAIIDSRFFKQDDKTYFCFDVSEEISISPNNYLHFAVLSGNYEITKKLLDLGMNPNDSAYAISDYYDAFECAKFSGNDKMLELLETKQISESLQNWLDLKNNDEYNLVNFRVSNIVRPFKIRMLDGEEISNESLKGKVVLVNFWATWCGYCREEMPSLNELGLNFDPAVFQIIAVSVDTDDRVLEMNNYINGNEFNFTYVRDPSLTTFSSYSCGVPGTYIISKQGTTVAKIEGGIDWTPEKYKKLIQYLIDLN